AWCGRRRRRRRAVRAGRRSWSAPRPARCTSWRSTSRWTGSSRPGSGSAARCWNAGRRRGAAAATTSTRSSTSSPGSGTRWWTSRPRARSASASARPTAAWSAPPTGRCAWSPPRAGRKSPSVPRAVGSRNLVYLHGDVGVGGGIIVGGRLLDGDEGYAAEVGHMIVNPYDGRPCMCGSRGCLEAEVGEPALLEAAGRTGGQIGREGVRAVVRAAENGDAAARRALDTVGDWLGIGVANLINLFNPGVVVFGGMLSEIYRGAASRVNTRVNESVLHVHRE